MSAPISYNVKDAAKAIGISPDELRTLVSRGLIDSFTLRERGHPMFLVARVEDFARRNPPAKAALMAAGPDRSVGALAARDGVYILSLEGRTVYVGRSSRLSARIRSHHRDGREFDAYEVIPCDQEKAVWLERELIRTLKPTQNLVRYSRHAAATDKTIPRVRIT